ncbi:MAG: hypothetical protein HY726_18720 [Candidatus Rokubacteria bacterium]|nr:hypothetical protein [Candidatus Rokubacteria bacterium]
MSGLDTLGRQRLLDLPRPMREELRRAVEAAERTRKLLHRVRAGARPTPHPIALTPFVIPRRLVPKLNDLALAVHRFQARAPSLYREGRLNFRSLCPLGDTSEAWLFRYGGDERDQTLMIRLDVGLTGDERPVLYETNSTALAGLFNHTAGVQILRRTVLPRLFSPHELGGLTDPPDLLALALRWVKETARHLGLGRRRPLGVAFVEPSGPGGGYSELPQIARYFASQGIQAACGDPRQLRLTDRGVSLTGTRVDLVYRDVAFEHLGHPRRSGRQLAGFVELLTRQAVIPGFAGEFDHKGILECLTSGAYRRFFAARELRILRECVPWTRVLWERKTEGPTGERIDLARYVRREKDRLLIKPNRGSGGEGLLLGREASAARWERRLERALEEKGRWVVQERLPAARRPMAYVQDGEIHFAPCYFSLGLFAVKGQLGLHCRISRFEIVNVGRGGALACVFLTR